MIIPPCPLSKCHYESLIGIQRGKIIGQYREYIFSFFFHKLLLSRGVSIEILVAFFLPRSSRLISRAIWMSRRPPDSQSRRLLKRKNIRVFFDRRKSNRAELHMCIYIRA